MFGVLMLCRRGLRSLKRNLVLAQEERAELAGAARELLHRWRDKACILPEPLQTGAQSYAAHKWVALVLAPSGPNYPWPLETQGSGPVGLRVRRYLRGTMKLSKRRRRLLEHATALSDVFALRVVFTTWRQFHAIVQKAKFACARVRCRQALQIWWSWKNKQV